MTTHCRKHPDHIDSPHPTETFLASGLDDIKQRIDNIRHSIAEKSMIVYMVGDEA
jgi:hypothetical protein